jgi:TorA maturation chaperone TorD
MIPFDKEPEVDTIQNILEYFSLLIEEEDESGMDDFFNEIIEPVIPAFCSHLYQGTVLNFYKELAKGLNALVQQLRPPENE